MSANLENSAVATELEKVSFHSNFPRDGGAWWAAVYVVSQSDTTEVT